MQFLAWSQWYFWHFCLSNILFSQPISRDQKVGLTTHFCRMICMCRGMQWGFPNLELKYYHCLHRFCCYTQSSPWDNLWFFYCHQCWIYPNRRSTSCPRCGIQKYSSKYNRRQIIEYTLLFIPIQPLTIAPWLPLLHLPPPC